MRGQFEGFDFPDLLLDVLAHEMRHGESLLRQRVFEAVFSIRYLPDLSDNGTENPRFASSLFTGSRKSLPLKNMELNISKDGRSFDAIKDSAYHPNTRLPQTANASTIR